MPTEEPVTTDVKSEEEIKQQEAQDNVITNVKGEKTVPYDRFQKVNQQKKELGDTLESILASMIDEIPEEFRELVPDIPPAQRYAWIKQARDKGLFSKQISNGPDSKRAGGKAPTDLSNMTNHELLKNGYKN